MSRGRSFIVHGCRRARDRTEDFLVARDFSAVISGGVFFRRPYPKNEKVPPFFIDRTVLSWTSKIVRFVKVWIGGDKN